jgi:FkbM family methyltransferase
VDIGASDGISGSNSYLLEKCLGWRGLCVEPRPGEMLRLQGANRTGCYAEEAALSSREGRAEFVLAGGLSGLKMHQEAYQVDRIETDAPTQKTIDVRVTTFAAALARAKLGPRIDFVSIDVEGADGPGRGSGNGRLCPALCSFDVGAMEGAEMAILESINFTALDIRAFVIENNQMEPTLCAFLEPRGYECRGRMHLLDEVFVKAHP